MPKKLPHKLFIETFKYAPRAAINLLIENPKGEILLVKRRTEPFAGFWHLPGSFIMKGEALVECIKRVGKDELGIEIDPKKAKFLGIFDDLYSDPRGHVIDIVYGIETAHEPADANFFEKLPDDIGFNHRKTLNKLGYY